MFSAILHSQEQPEVFLENAENNPNYYFQQIDQEQPNVLSAIPSISRTAQSVPDNINAVGFPLYFFDRFNIWTIHRPKEWYCIFEKFLIFSLGLKVLSCRASECQKPKPPPCTVLFSILKVTRINYMKEDRCFLKVITFGVRCSSRKISRFLSSRKINNQLQSDFTSLITKK